VIPFAPISTPSEPSARRAKYLLAADQIRDRIQRGVFRPGDRLPSERDLADSFGLAHLTLRQALQHLEREGLVHRHHGKGTFVAEPLQPDSTRRAETAKVAPIYLLGLGPQMDARRDPVNWEIHLLRYQGIVEGGFQFGYPIQAPAGWKGRLTKPLLEQLMAGAGVILNGDKLSADDLKTLVDSGVRVVAINRHRELLCSEVQVDTKQGTMLAIEHLLQLGHRRIGIIAGDQHKPLMQLRVEGYKEALRNYKVPFCPSLMVTDARGSVEDGAKAVEKLLQNPEPPTAVFTTSDRRAIGAMARAKELGWSVPDKLSIVGFDDLQEASELDPALTTVHNPLHESGFEAVRLLHQHAQDPDLGIQVVRLPMSLAIRQSTVRLHTPNAKRTAY
jgi:DNA-binding transcriptional regulator YhcF (GntR family)/CheY-like chemotaxis protein